MGVSESTMSSTLAIVQALAIAYFGSRCASDLEPDNLRFLLYY